MNNPGGWLFKFFKNSIPVISGILYRGERGKIVRWRRHNGGCSAIGGSDFKPERFKILSK